MKRSPFLDDPNDQVANHITAAMTSPIEELRAMHIRAAEHLSEIAKQSGLQRSARKS
jgi:tRNA(Phe) wybutosine-synthesizing methylase Tyw3